MSVDTKVLQNYIYRMAANHPAYQSFLNAHLLQGPDAERKTLYDRVLSEHGDRLRYYQYAWDLYLGNHWFSYSNKKPNPVTINYIAISVNKNVSFLMNKGFLVESDFPEIEKLLQSTYKKNYLGQSERNELGWEMGLMGCITGDTWVSTLFSADDNQEEYVQIKLMSSMHCFPVLSFEELVGLLYYRFEKYVATEDMGFALYNTQMGGYYYKPGYRTRIVDEKAGLTEEFIYTEMPITHIKNFPSPVGYYGFSDIRNISELNRLYNKVVSSVNDIVEYQGAPVTIIKGGKGNDLVRGANRVWSLTNKDADISNLELTSDLKAISDHIGRIGEAIHEGGNLPITSTGAKELSISNTSASALAITFMPLYETMELKRIMYGKGFLQVNRSIIKLNILAKKLDVNQIIKRRIERWDETYKGAGPKKREEAYPFRVKINPQVDYNSLYAYYNNLIPEEIFETYITWFPPLPRDEKTSNDIAIANVNAKMWSIRHARSYIGMTEEESKLMDKEIEEDVKKYPELYSAQTTVTNKKTGMEGNPDVKGEKESKRQADED